MDRNRRALLAAGLALAAEAALTTDDSRADPPPTPAEGGLDAPVWPPPERLSLWPGAPPGSPETLPAPSLTMNGPRGERLLHVSGIAHPEINVFRAPRPDGSALLVFPGGAYRFVSVQNEGLDVATGFRFRMRSGPCGSCAGTPRASHWTPGASGFSVSRPADTSPPTSFPLSMSAAPSP